MRILPKTKFKLQTRTNGYRYAIIYREWLWTKILFEFPLSLEFWPTELKIPLPKGIRFPKQPQPTEEESALVAELMEQRGYKVIRKFWNWQALVFTYGCTTETNGIGEAQGLFKGFLKARTLVEQIAHWGEGKEEGEIEMEGEEEMYLNQRRMDKMAESEL